MMMINAAGPQGTIAERPQRRISMTQTNQAEPPSWLRPPLFMIGRDHRGNWVVQDQTGTRGGLFVDRDAAMRFVRFEGGDRPQAFIMVSEPIELDMSRNSRAAFRREAGVDAGSHRRIA
jgi:hypothetical protein